MRGNSLWKTRMTYQSPYSEIVYNVTYGNTSKTVLNVTLGNPSEVQEFHKARGGILTFSRSSGNSGELHAIRLHETVEASVVAGGATSQIEDVQPFKLTSEQDFVSSRFKTPSVCLDGNNTLVLANGDALKWMIESPNGFSKETVDRPSILSVVTSTSGVNQIGQRVICLYVESGNVYARVE